MQELNIENTPNQIMNVSVDIRGIATQLELDLRFNTIAGYWTINIRDVAKDKIVISSMPLIHRTNLLEQYQYLELGDAYVIGISNKPLDSLNMDNLGKDFVFIWDGHNE